MSRRAVALGALLVALAGCGGQETTSPSSSTPASTPRARVEEVGSTGLEGGFDAQRIYEEEAPGVVTIQSLFGE